MKRLITIPGIIVLGVLAITLFSNCDINSPFIEEIQEKIDTDLEDATPSYAVTFDSQGGSLVDAQTVIEAGMATAPGEPERAGYIFGEWYKELAYTNLWDFGSDTVIADVTLYAKWTMIDINSPNIGLLKVVPAGSFQRDSASTNISVITKPFRMSEKEITRAQILSIMGTDPSHPAYSSGTSDPVQQSNWYHAIAFCNQLSIDEGLTSVYTVNGSTVPDVWDGTTDGTITVPTSNNVIWDAATANWSANGYRLPTEMEWMWAAMGADDDYTKLFAGSNGSNAIGDYAVFGYSGSETGRTTTERSNPVGSKLPNELGLYDMSGDVWEWNWDWYEDNGTWPNYVITGTVTDYRGAASGSDRVLRGGSWYNNAPFCSVAYRYFNYPYYQLTDIGFRVVRP
jgi:formylglycine-generating enzyme